MFEYKVVDIDEINQPEDKYLEFMGKEGWELIQINNEPHKNRPLVYVKFYFKKKVDKYLIWFIHKVTKTINHELINI